MHDVPPAEVSVLLTSDAHIQALNAEYRKVEKPTDVLTFPGPGQPGMPLGDIVVSMETAGRQASARGQTLENEVALLVVHGGLHLLGFEDETDRQRTAMVREMGRAAQVLGLEFEDDWSTIYQEAKA